MSASENAIPQARNSGPSQADVDVGAPRECRCCGSHRVRLRGRKPGEFLRREFEFHACDDCGFMMVEPFSGFEIYNDAYYRGAGPDPFVDYEAEYHNWRQSDRMLEFDDLASIAATHAAAAPAAATLRWLDFGCGAGGFLKYLRARGDLAGRPLDLTGHDVGSYADLLRDQDGFRILDLDALAREPDATYDVISLIEVIEHLPAPLEPMRLVARLLKPRRTAAAHHRQSRVVHRAPPGHPLPLLRPRDTRQPLQPALPRAAVPSRGLELAPRCATTAP
jgi:SAM-dependent methyltransferase